MPSLLTGGIRLGADGLRRVELAQLDPAAAVRCPEHGDIASGAVEPDQAVHHRSLDGCLALELQAEVDKERDGSLEVVDHDADVVHARDRHVRTLPRPAATNPFRGSLHVDITASAVSLNVADPDASAAFVTDHLGFSTDMQGDGFHSLSRPDAGFNLIFLRTGLSTFKPDAQSGQAGGLLVVFVVRDIDADHQRLVERGVEITTPLQTEPWGEQILPGHRSERDRDPTRAVGRGHQPRSGAIVRIVIGPAAGLTALRPPRPGCVACA